MPLSQQDALEVSWKHLILKLCAQSQCRFRSKMLSKSIVVMMQVMTDVFASQCRFRSKMLSKPVIGINSEGRAVLSQCRFRSKMLSKLNNLSGLLEQPNYCLNAAFAARCSRSVVSVQGAIPANLSQCRFRSKMLSKLVMFSGSEKICILMSQCRFRSKMLSKWRINMRQGHACTCVSMPLSQQDALEEDFWFMEKLDLVTVSMPLSQQDALEDCMGKFNSLMHEVSQCRFRSKMLSKNK